MANFFTSALKKILGGDKHEKDLKKHQPNIDKINNFFESYKDLSNDELRNKTIEFRARIADHLKGIDSDIEAAKKQADSEEDMFAKESIFDDIDAMKKSRDQHLEDILLQIMPEAFAVVKETARRFTENDVLKVTATEHDREIAAGKNHVLIDGDTATWKTQWLAAGGDIDWKMVHYDVQLIGGMVLHDGKIAEMATGEGKTLVATLPAYLNGLAGEGVHVITVNNYLAIRDSEWIGPIMEFLLLTIDCIDKYRPHSPQRIKAYNCDITYGTNNEFGFDYLRDNMVASMDEVVQSKHHFAMLDEVDSVLIDDARTPLIISGPVPKGTEEQEYQALKPRVEKLLAEQRKLATHYLAEAKKLFKDNIIGTGEGEAGMALLRANRALPKYRPLIKFMSEEGVKVLYQKTNNVYMAEQNKKMHIVDKPLYFTIDEKNRSVDLTDKGAELLAKGGDDPDFFVMPDIATGMMEIEKGEGTEEEKVQAKQDLIQDFAAKSKRLHSIYQLLKAYTLFEKDEEYVVMDGEVKIVDEQTGRMMEGRRYSDGLHQALEAKENVEIGDITQTYATVTLQNFFRMYHKLAGMTGTAETEASELWEIYKLEVSVIPTNKPIIRDDKEDLIFKTAREKFNHVADDIVKLSEAGRPVLVGTTSVDISEKLSRMLNMRGITHNVLNAKQHQREAEIVAQAGNAGQVTIATNMAGRGTDIKLSPEVIQAGGLAIIGTERHDSRRVDRQLRGRAGRQGDPGSSQFYVSLEDNLMRLFQSDRIAKLMDKMGHKEGDVIQHSMVSKSIEKAQKKVEENNFGIRKRLLDYDDVMNIQREAIYKKRNNALSGDRLSVDLNNMFVGLTQSMVEMHKQNGNYDTFKEACLTILGLDPTIDLDQFRDGSVDDTIKMLQDQVFSNYKNKEKSIVDVLLPWIKNIKKTEGDRYKRVAIPFSDGRAKPLNISANINKAIETEGKSIMTDIEKAVTLALIDESWKEHLRSMDELKDSVQAASFEQKDPLVIYKVEAYQLFEELIYKINEEVTSLLLNGKLIVEGPVREAKQEKLDTSKMQTSRSEDQEAMKKAASQAGQQQRQKVQTFKRTEKKVGRNEPCPCGSGKKFKQCHGK